MTDREKIVRFLLNAAGDLDAASHEVPGDKVRGIRRSAAMYRKAVRMLREDAAAGKPSTEDAHERQD